MTQLSYKKLELLFEMKLYREVELNIVCDISESSRSSIDYFQSSRNQQGYEVIVVLMHKDLINEDDIRDFSVC